MTPGTRRQVRDFPGCCGNFRSRRAWPAASRMEVQCCGPPVADGRGLVVARRSADARNDHQVEQRDAVMNCACNLLRDHDDIAAIVRVLAATVRRLCQDGYVDAGMLAGLDRFLREFVVDCHFRKEDTIIFPHVRAVMPKETGRTIACTSLHRDVPDTWRHVTWPSSGPMMLEPESWPLNL